MHVSRNIEARSSNHRSSGKALIITQPECVFVALSIQHEMSVSHIVTIGLPRSRILFHIIS